MLMQSREHGTRRMGCSSVKARVEGDDTAPEWRRKLKTRASKSSNERGPRWSSKNSATRVRQDRLIVKILTWEHFDQRRFGSSDEYKVHLAIMTPIVLKSTGYIAIATEKVQLFFG